MARATNLGDSDAYAISHRLRILFAETNNLEQSDTQFRADVSDITRSFDPSPIRSVLVVRYAFCSYLFNDLANALDLLESSQPDRDFLSQVLVQEEI